MTSEANNKEYEKTHQYFSVVQLNIQPRKAMFHCQGYKRTSKRVFPRVHSIINIGISTTPKYHDPGSNAPSMVILRSASSFYESQLSRVVGSEMPCPCNILQFNKRISKAMV